MSTLSDDVSPSEVIDALGGTAETARICKVEPSAVSQWRINGIPTPRLMFLELLRPDLFGGKTNRRKANKKH